MRRSASEIIRNLEMRVARLEKRASMRTGSKNETFYHLFKLAKSNQKDYRSLETGELETGGRAISADLQEMRHFLDAVVKAKNERGGDPGYDDFGKARGKLYIVEDQHTYHGNDLGLIAVVQEEELHLRPQYRKPFFFYI